jgi:hypothetical protein
MDRYRIKGEVVTTNLSREELGRRVSKSSALIKMMCGNKIRWK